MAKVEREAAKERFWREALAVQAASGQSVRAYCQREGLSQSSFYAWRRTIAERDGAKAPPFVPVVVTDTAPSEASIAVDLAGGHVLRLPASTSAAWLAELVLALEARPSR